MFILQLLAINYLFFITSIPNTDTSTISIIKNIVNASPLLDILLPHTKTNKDINIAIIHIDTVKTFLFKLIYVPPKYY